MAQKEYKIVDGPSKESLFTELSLPATRQNVLVFLAENINMSSPLKINIKPKFELWLESIQKEDGSGESWNLTGTIQKKRVEMYYSSQRRKGHLTILD